MKIKYIYITVILFILLLVISYYFINKYYNNQNNIIYNEVICVGGGITSGYICYALRNKGYNKNIIVLEKDNRIGGRLFSVYSNENESETIEANYNELGGMRLFKNSYMTKIFDLLDELNIETIHVSLKDSDNIFYYKGEHIRKGDTTLSNGISISNITTIALNNVKKQYPDFELEKIDNYPEIVQMNVFDFYKKYALLSDEDVNKYISYTGYNLRYDENNYETKYLSIVPELRMENWYTSKKSDDQVYIKSGMLSIVNKLYERSNANIKLNTTVMYIQKDEDGLNVLHTITSDHVYKIYKCKYLFLNVTPRSIEQLDIIKPLTISSERKYMIKQIIPMPLMKVFLKWDNDKLWWRNKGLMHGKSTSDLEARMIHYYNDEDLMVYSTGSYASSLYLKFLENPAAAAKYIFYMIQEVHPFPIPEPNYAFTLWKYWPDGTNRWKTTVVADKFTHTIPNGIIDNSNIFIAGDAYSLYQGWIIGCIESADIALDIFLSQK
jgi:monoamine oxidase